MENQSRVEKYKDYRNSMISEDAPVLETPKLSKDRPSNEKEASLTTSTLPIDQVMQTMREDDQEAILLKKRRNLRILKYVLIGLGIAIAITGTIFLGIYLWRN